MSVVTATAPRSSGRLARIGRQLRRIAVTALVTLFGAGAVLVGVVAAIGARLPDGPDLVRILTSSQVIVDLQGATGEALCICFVRADPDAIPEHLRQAFLAAEDRRFEVHGGVDWIGTARAIWNSFWTRQGGSTLTQQLAKGLVVSDETSGLAGIFRKMREAIIAVRAEHFMSKDEILMAYLDAAPFGAVAGRQIYGVAQAARVFFGKDVSTINLFEAAVLAATVNASSALNPERNPEANGERARLILDRMVALGFVTADEAEAAIATGVRPGRIDPYSFEPRYYVDWAIREAREALGGGEGTVRIVLGLVPEVQIAAEEALARALQEGGAPRAQQASLLAMTPEGVVLAMVGGRDYAESQYDRATLALRQPGSAFKPFVFAAAVAAGWQPEDLVLDAPVRRGWPDNFDGRYYGWVPMQTALSQSLNGATVWLADAIGVGTVITTARRAGIGSLLGEDPSLALGAYEVTLVELTSAYAALASGFVVAPAGVTAVLDDTGWTLWARNVAPTRIFDDTVVTTMRTMLADVVAGGTGRAAQVDLTFVAGKTGTSSDYRDAWFVGFTDRLIGGIWTGNDDSSPMPNVTGGGIPARAFHYLLESLASARVIGASSGSS